jgi:hypothetical protein
MSSCLRELTQVCYLSTRAVIAWPLAVTFLLHLSALEARGDSSASTASARILLVNIHCAMCCDTVYQGDQFKDQVCLPVLCASRPPHSGKFHNCRHWEGKLVPNVELLTDIPNGSGILQHYRKMSKRGCWIRPLRCLYNEEPSG